jgi:hypothetical protein
MSLFLKKNQMDVKGTHWNSMELNGTQWNFIVKSKNCEFQQPPPNAVSMAYVLRGIEPMPKEC